MKHDDVGNKGWVNRLVQGRLTVYIIFVIVIPLSVILNHFFGSQGYYLGIPA
jgi:hypothetical protein